MFMYEIKGVPGPGVAKRFAKFWRELFLSIAIAREGALTDVWGSRDSVELQLNQSRLFSFTKPSHDKAILCTQDAPIAIIMGRQAYLAKLAFVCQALSPHLHACD
jgi:hypothetical protein